MRYCLARYADYAEDKAYRVYVTDTLKIIAENTSKFVRGSSPKMRYYDIIHPKPEETRTQEDIVAQIREKLNG